MAPDRAEDDVLEHAEVREQVVGLEDEAEPAAHANGVDRRVGDHLAVEEDVAVVDLLEQVDAAQQGRLARAGGADHRDGLVLGDLEVDPVEDLSVAESLRHAPKLEDRRVLNGSSRSGPGPSDPGAAPSGSSPRGREAPRR